MLPLDSWSDFVCRCCEGQYTKNHSNGTTLIFTSIWVNCDCICKHVKIIMCVYLYAYIWIICICICMVQRDIHMYVCIYIYLYICIHRNNRVYMYLQYIYIYICLFIHIHTCAYMSLMGGVTKLKSWFLRASWLIDIQSGLIGRFDPLFSRFSGRNEANDFLTFPRNPD